MRAPWPDVPLLSICTPKQWPTVTAAQMTDCGFPVYGANGKIGFYGEFNHSNPTVLIGCRGSCGSITVCEANSYVTGNAMALDSLDDDRVALRYLFRVLQQTDLSKAITGTSQPQITRSSLKNIAIPLPPIEEQRRITCILDQADALRVNRLAAMATQADLNQALLEQYMSSASMTLKSIGDLLANGDLLLHKDGNHGSNYPRAEEFGA